MESIQVLKLYIFISFLTFGLNFGYQAQQYNEGGKNVPYKVIFVSLITAALWPLLIPIEIGRQIRKSEDPI